MKLCFKNKNKAHKTSWKDWPSTVTAKDKRESRSTKALPRNQLVEILQGWHKLNRDNCSKLQSETSSWITEINKKVHFCKVHCKCQELSQERRAYALDRKDNFKVWRRLITPPWARISIEAPKLIADQLKLVKLEREERIEGKENLFARPSQDLTSWSKTKLQMRHQRVKSQSFKKKKVWHITTAELLHSRRLQAPYYQFKWTADHKSSSTEI